MLEATADAVNDVDEYIKTGSGNAEVVLVNDVSGKGIGHDKP